MAASRLLNIQHHRIAQCQSVQINILGEEEVPIQVDGEAWLQPPGTIRIIHKNRVQMLCRNRNLEISLKSWQQKQRQSISVQRDRSSSVDRFSSSDENLSEKERINLFYFIETVYMLIKSVKIFIITHPFLNKTVYDVAIQVSEALEVIHPNGQLLEGSELRLKLTEVVRFTQNLYEDSNFIIKHKQHSFQFKEDLLNKLNSALANVEMELKKISMEPCSDGYQRVYFNSMVCSENI